MLTQKSNSSLVAAIRQKFGQLLAAEMSKLGVICTGGCGRFHKASKSFVYGAPGMIRTCDLLVRRLMQERILLSCFERGKTKMNRN